MNQEKIGNLIKEIRKKNNLTQAEFAERYGVTYQTVSKWENGKNIPDIMLLKQISEDFDNIPTAQLDDILFELGVKEFERIYCVHLSNL